MTYSCPIWKPKSEMKEGEKEESLESAQMRKLDRFISNARIKSTDHVLEIGTGWASFAIRAVQKTGCRITSLTLSREQRDLANKRIANAGLTDKIEVLLCDYRSLPMPTEGPYDKIISIEMLEAVGREFLSTYFECVHKLLKPQGGIAVFQCITIPDARYEAYSKGEDFIRKYIFPGGHLPCVSQLVRSINEGSKGLLVVEGVEDIGAHYAKTLRIWKENFMKNFESRIRPALLVEHHGMTEADAALFRRKWEVCLFNPTRIAFADVLAVLLYILRSWFRYCDSGRCHHHCSAGRLTRAAGGYTPLMVGPQWSHMNLTHLRFFFFFFGFRAWESVSATVDCGFREAGNFFACSLSKTDLSRLKSSIHALASSILQCSPTWILRPRSSDASRLSFGVPPPASFLYGGCRAVSRMSFLG